MPGLGPCQSQAKKAPAIPKCVTYGLRPKATDIRKQDRSSEVGTLKDVPKELAFILVPSSVGVLDPMFIGMFANRPFAGLPGLGP